MYNFVKHFNSYDTFLNAIWSGEDERTDVVIEGIKYIQAKEVYFKYHVDFKCLFEWTEEISLTGVLCNESPVSWVLDNGEHGYIADRWANSDELKEVFFEIYWILEEEYGVLPLSFISL